MNKLISMRKTTAILLVFTTVLWMTNLVAFAAEDSATTTMLVESSIPLPAESQGVLNDSVNELAAVGATTTAPLDGFSISQIINDSIATSSEESGAPIVDDPAPVDSTSTIEIDIDDLLPEDEATSTEEIASATTTIDLNESQMNASTTIESATSTLEVATSTMDGVALATVETATSTAGQRDALLTADNLGSGTARFSVLAVWQMDQDGRDDGAAEFGQFMPSGQYQVSKKIKICGAVDGDSSLMDGVYGQMFYPNNINFAPNDAQGRQGCGKVTGPICKMQKLDRTAGFDLLCEKIQKNNTNLPLFATGLNYIDLCTIDGKLLSETAAVYCCDEELAYDDIAGVYDASVIVKGVSGDYSDLLTSKLSYLPLAKIDLDFNNVYYGTVKENVEAVAAFGKPNLGEDEAFGMPNPLVRATENISRATARNVGNMPAKLSLWQDDMGLGRTDGIYNIRYGARVSGIDASWTNYEPFETTVMPEVIAPGQSVNMDFSVKVLNFPQTASSTVDYNGKMEINAVIAEINYQCQTETQPEVANEPLEIEKTDIKPETETIDNTATTSVPI